VVSPLVAERPRTSGGTHDRRRRGEGNHGESGGVRLTVLTEGENVAPGVGTYNTPSSSFGKQRVGTAKSGSRATFGTASKVRCAQPRVGIALIAFMLRGVACL